jgi:hypothetical protein
VSARILGRAVRATAAALAVAASLVGPVPIAGEDDPVLARAFEVRYRPPADAAELVEELLSDDGSLTIQPRLNVLVVSDRSSVLAKVESLLASFDLPPRQVDVTLSLFLGTKRRDGETSRTERSGSLIDLPPLQFTKWTSYESLGSRSVNGIEGGEVTADLGPDFRVSFRVDTVDERQGVVRFSAVTLERVGRTAQGQEKIDKLLSAAGVVDVGKQYIFGAAAGPDADRALFLTLRASPR